MRTVHYGREQLYCEHRVLLKQLLPEYLLCFRQGLPQQRYLRVQL